MANITAQLVKELRELTGSGMMDCKKALTAVEGDIDKAADWLRENGILKAQKKASRIAAEGLVRTEFNEDHTEAAIVEVNSETDFVAKNEEFIGFVEKMAKQALTKVAATVDDFMALDLDGDGKTVKEELTEKIAKIGENLNVRRFDKMKEDGVKYVGYTHGGGRIGVIVGLKTEAAFNEIEQVGKDVAMQVASMAPKFVNAAEVAQDWLENEKKILKEALINENPNKAAMADKIVEGQIRKELKEVCLTEQAFVKDSDKSVKQYVEEAAKALGKAIEVVSMKRYEVGEGLEKKEENFAEEVAAQMNK
ncbi:MAG: translation elongation factor Ts [Mogibacterium sp.]|nr:translation elongation factor Ts [Mogibacterium sp.]